MKLNKYIDHTLLKPTATRTEIAKLCHQAMQYDFYSVCVNACYIALAKDLLKGSAVSICSVVGFPLGAMQTVSKAAETKHAISNGADEIDMVMNIGALKSNDYNVVLKDIKDVKQVLNTKILKVIIETCYLNNNEIIKATDIVNESGANFIKTSTGFGTRGASLEDIQLIKTIANPNLKIKASGGIRDYNTALSYVQLGADRIGTSSGVKIVEHINN